MLLDVLLAVMFSYEFRIIMICLACVLMYAIHFIIFGNRKDEDNA
jgi:ABC-type bacteriocin/lantibiotic exporter with double-glycine peptidase domain